ncbi:cell surface protein SprA [Pseudobacter ginsenosidimutans]|uniref:Cell surface protein SprA n=1 Tax=Pseudobacter ginsenosidimutans TaxID=661488 RepID=A0A4Q7MKV0_9BACT|nr:cell surface protein SprA [Pseudobacter ginsenosidimutans]
MARNINHHNCLTAICIAVLVLLCTTAKANHAPQQDTSVKKTADTLKYPIHDRRGDRYSAPRKRSFDLPDPANITDSVVYDPKTKQYYIIEKVGNFYFRKPTSMTFEEFLNLQARKSENDYFQKRSNILSSLNRKLLRPRMSVTDNLFNRIFGNGKIEIRPQGEVNLIAGYQGQNIKNPSLPERARRNGGFDFDMNANLSVIGNIGDKLKLPINYNTLANMDFENQLKLDYTGTDDEIIKRIEAGNVSWTSKGSLIPGAQQLFGIKTELQFGKLSVSAVMANQRSQRQSMNVAGGSSNMYFEFKANDYEENRHFLLAQYFRNQYNQAMSKLPVVSSKVQILRMEVWVTNRNGSTTETRDVVGLMDLAEPDPFNNGINPLSAQPYPSNESNDLYQRIVSDPNSRNSALITSKLSTLGLQPVQDFEKTFARKLSPTEYYFNPQVGFLSLNQPLQPDEVLGVAYQYSYNGRILQVGEFSQDVTPDTTVNKGGTQKIFFLKLLKATSQRTNLPLWDLMMKNVYALKSKDNSYLSSVQPQDFKLNVLYEQPSLGQKRFLPEGDRVGVPIITLLNLDRLNARNDPMPDGVFDYIEGFTVMSQQARIIFPFLEPFGRDLDSVAFRNSSQDLKDKYVYYPLYDTIKAIAQTYANLDRYIISGYAKGNSNSEINLNAFNIPRGSVTVMSGGQLLKEDVDYTIDYNVGTLRVINPAILASGVPVNVQFENNASIGIQQRNFMGIRLGYQVKNTARESLSIGASMVRLGERPFFTKTQYNDDPIRNTMYGLDFNYRTESPKLTSLLNKLPFYETNVMSTITAYGEAALLKPGHPPQIGKGKAGLIFIDDFEGSRNSIDLRFPLVSWGISSTPANNGLFPEANYRDSLPYGFNRAKIAWYNIEPVLQDRRSGNNPVRSYEDFSDPRIRPVNLTQIYPNRTPDLGQSQLVTFDIAYYPTDKGPYNFDAENVTADGKLLNPQTRWGGIMRGLDQVDFETGNVEFIEFWMQDPYIKTPSSTGGQLYFNLGNISEDVLKDGKRFFENGISGAVTKALEDPDTRWGKVPGNPIQVTQAFSNDPADRQLQDAGFDGLVNDAEREKFAAYLQELANRFGTSSKIYQDALKDPSNDDFLNYRDGQYDQSRSGILGRYKNYNGPQGNSPVATNQTNVAAFTMLPDQEEFNRDNTLNELEEYFQYRVELKSSEFEVGQNFITDSIGFTPNGGIPEKWYLFRIPIAQYEKKVGNIPDFKSIRFIRMFLTGFEDSVVLRFAKLELVRNTWRRFSFELDTTGTYKPIPTNTTTTFNQLAVNVEENNARRPVPYRTPPGVERQQALSNNNVNLLLNEQSMSLKVCNLARQESRGVFKTMNLDLRQYGRMQLYIHAESVNSSSDIRDNELYGVVRLGADLINNYYEIKIPLKMTPWFTSDAQLIWPLQNELDLALDRLIQLKVSRNNNGQVSNYYKQTDADGKEYAILGNPNLGEVRIFFLGVENRNREEACTEIWFNELRLSDLDEKGGWAALGRVDIQLADLGTLYIAGAAHTAGFGTLEQRINERSRDNFSQFDIATNLELGKLIPQKAGMSIPFYASYSKAVSTPEYDPYDLDVKLKDKLKAASGDIKDSIRDDAIDVKTIRSFAFTNVRKNNTSGKKQQIWSVENIDVSYSYYKEEQHNPLIENNELIRHRAAVGYNYTSTPKFWEPAKRMIKSRSPWLALFKDFNINPIPSLLGFRADVNRQFGAFRPRNVGGPKGGLPETYDKFFTFDRFYNLRWDLTRSFNVDFTAVNKSWVDEDSGRLDDREKKSMWHNFWKGGRTISYNQHAEFSYNVPMNKIPALNWTTLRASYAADFDWIGASLIARELGNTLSNQQRKTLTFEMDFTQLYSKSRFLRAIEDDNPAAPKAPRDPKDTTKRKRDRNEPLVLSPGAKFAGRFLTMVKRAKLEYSEVAGATIYGYTDSTRALGMNFKSGAPGLPFIFGKQPDTSFISTMAQKGWLSADSNFNFQNRQDYTQRFNITAQLQPIRDLMIDITIDKQFGKNYSELYKDTTGTGLHFARLNPYSAGSFRVTYISFQTLFKKVEANTVSEMFQRFQDYRYILSKRLAESNPYWQSLPETEKFLSDGYYRGYSRYAQDVLIPAFIAAYTGKDPKSVPLLKQNNPNIRSNPFSGILPRPNWRITYTGLTRIKALEKIFTNFTVSHGYNSTLGMNSFNSALLYRDDLRYGFPGFLDSAGNYVPYFLVPNITISEEFSPLIDLDMQFTNQLTARFEYKKSRTLSLSLIDYQLSETRTTEFTIGAGFRKRGAFSWIKWKGKPLENDASFRLDLSLRDDITANSRLDQEQTLPTNGAKTIFINPSVDYVISNRVNVKLYFEQRRVTPKISSSPPITNTRAGVQVRISLAQ